MKRELLFLVFTLILITGLWAQIPVWNATDLDNVRYNLTGDYIQMADIYLVGEWIPISVFGGTYDGGGFNIIGLYINDDTETPQGLFGYTNGATITNVTFIDIDITTVNGRVGGLAGYAQNGTTIEYCSTYGGQIDIRGGGADVGGLVGILEDSNISYSYNTVTVRGFDRVGGLIGRSIVTSPENENLIYRCYNIAAVIDSDNVGGLVGVNGLGSKIEECYSANLVDGIFHVGGLVGWNEGIILNSFTVCTAEVRGDYIGGLVGLNFGIIENCYSNRIVNCIKTDEFGNELPGDHPGGLVGYHGPSGNWPEYGWVYNSYWDADVTPGGFTYYWPYDPNYPSRTGYARTTDDMTWVHGSDTYLDWDFEDIWAADEAGTLNRGYPTLANVDFYYDCDPDDPQPVELSSFTASVIASGIVNLEWRTETETNVLGYYVYRGEYNYIDDAINLNHLIIIAMNSSTESVYSFVDEDVLFGSTYYYWLQSVDLDLTTTYHGPITITITDDETVIPPEELFTKLHQNYPNPFNPDTVIKYSLAERVSNMELNIYNLRGQEIRTLKSGPHDKGKFEVVWDGQDSYGKTMASGIYFYRMTTPDFTATYKMMLLK